MQTHRNSTNVSFRQDANT